MKSIIVSLSGNTPYLSTNFHPELELDERFEYSCCLLDFSIQNISMKHIFDVGHSLSYTCKEAVRSLTISGEQSMPSIMYDVETHLAKEGCKLQIYFDKYKMKFRIKTSNDTFTFTPNSIGSAIGFDPQKLGENSITYADHSIGQFDVEAIRVNCDLVGGSFHNGISTHTVHEFQPKPVSNYKLIEQPQHLIYLPIIKQRINSVNITVTDQDGNLLNLKGGEIHCH